MNVSLPRELEKVVRQQVKSGFFSDESDVIRNAIRQTYCPTQPDPYLDSPEIAEKIRQARKGRYQPYRAGDFDRVLEKVVSRKRR
jgi:hypothetical protein